LQKMLVGNEPAALEAFWVLNLRGEIDEAGFRQQLKHPNAHVRRWAVRLLGDQGSVSSQTAAELRRLAGSEPEVEVRSQLASTAKRLPAGQAMPIIRQLLGRNEDAGDKHLPLLIWWALESKAETGQQELLAMLQDPGPWKSEIFRTHTAGRIAMRYAADQGPRKYYTLKQGVYSDWIIERAPEYFARNLEMCGRLLATAPSAAEAEVLVDGMARGM